jgi:GST-like protein
VSIAGNREASPRATRLTKDESMIELHYWTTPNGRKITIFIEESGLPRRIVPVNISAGDQFKPEFLKFSPNSRIPGIVDDDPAEPGPPISVFESGEIMPYLAEKTGTFLPKDLRGRTDVLQWLFWQVGCLGPMAGQNHHFSDSLRDRPVHQRDKPVLLRIRIE